MRKALLLAFAVSLPLFSLHPASVIIAQESEPLNSWEDTISVEDLGAVTSSENKGDTLCKNKTMRQKQILYDDVTTNSDGSASFNKDLGVRSEDIAVCVIQNSRGLFGLAASSLWSVNGDPNNGLEVKVTGASIDPAPASDVVLLKIPASQGYYLSINYDIRSIGRLTIDNKTPVSGQQWQLINTADALRYENNSPIRFTKHSFSQNGRYLVGQLMSGSLVVINLFSKKVNVFANETRAVTSMSVSSNGENVAVYRSGNLNLYKTTNCGVSYDFSLWPEQAPNISDCFIENLMPKIAGTYPFIGGSSTKKVRFALNSASLTIDAAWRNHSSEVVWNRFEFKPANYSPNVSGYLAMGDSFSSGEGDTEGGTWYEPGTDEQGDKDTFAGRNLCHLSRRSYPYLMAVELGYLATNSETPPADGLFHSVACSGAKTQNIIGVIGEKQDEGIAVDFSVTDNQYRFFASQTGSWLPGYEKQIGYLEGRNDEVSVREKFSPKTITIGVGGNDAGFGQKLLACLKPDTCEFASSEEKRSDVLIEIASEKQNLKKVFSDIKTASPETTVYVIGYPEFVQASGGTCANNVKLDSDERFFVSTTTKYFNEVIKSAAAEAGVTYVDVEDILQGKNLCSGVADNEITVNGVTAGNDISITPVDSGVFQYGLCVFRDCVGNETYHPNPKAHVLYKERILSVTENATIKNQEHIENLLPIPSSYYGIRAANYIRSINNFEPSTEEIRKLKEIVRESVDYQTVNIGLRDLLPVSDVIVSIESTPTEIGTFTVDQDGKFNQTITIPETVGPGYHELLLSGIDKFGNKVVYYQPVTLAESADDFDGDGVLNDEDSCPTITNSGDDNDQDGIDDACDGEITEPPQPPPAPEPEPEPEKPLRTFFRRLFSFLSLFFFRWFN